MTSTSPSPVRPRVAPVYPPLPEGAGRCPGCGCTTWLPAGPMTTPCAACIDAGARLAAAARAVAPALAEDPAEVCLRGEMDPPED